MALGEDVENSSGQRSEIGVEHDEQTSVEHRDQTSAAQVLGDERGPRQAR